MFCHKQISSTNREVDVAVNLFHVLLPSWLCPRQPFVIWTRNGKGLGLFCAWELKVWISILPYLHMIITVFCSFWTKLTKANKLKATTQFTSKQPVQPLIDYQWPLQYWLVFYLTSLFQFFTTFCLKSWCIFTTKLLFPSFLKYVF